MSGSPLRRTLVMPSPDVDGGDAEYRLSVSSQLGVQKWVTHNAQPLYDIRLARRSDYAAERRGSTRGRVSARVGGDDGLTSARCRRQRIVGSHHDILLIRSCRHEGGATRLVGRSGVEG